MILHHKDELWTVGITYSAYPAVSPTAFKVFLSQHMPQLITAYGWASKRSQLIERIISARYDAWLEIIVQSTAQWMAGRSSTEVRIGYLNLYLVRTAV